MTLEEKGGLIRRLHLGSIANHTVYEAKVTGAILALDIIQATPHIRSASILSLSYKKPSAEDLERIRDEESEDKNTKIDEDNVSPYDIR